MAMGEEVLVDSTPAMVEISYRPAPVKVNLETQFNQKSVHSNPPGPVWRHFAHLIANGQSDTAQIEQPYPRAHGSPGLGGLGVCDEDKLSIISDDHSVTSGASSFTTVDQALDRIDTLRTTASRYSSGEQQGGSFYSGSGLRSIETKSGSFSEISSLAEALGLGIGSGSADGSVGFNGRARAKWGNQSGLEVPAFLLPTPGSGSPTAADPRLSSRPQWDGRSPGGSKSPGGGKSPLGRKGSSPISISRPWDWDEAGGSPGPAPAPAQCSVSDLISELREGSVEDRRSASSFLRMQCKDHPAIRQLIVQFGGLDALAELMQSPDHLTMEYTVTAVHNLAVTPELQASVLADPVIDALVHVLHHGRPTAQSNAAATMYHLSRNVQQATCLASHCQIYLPLVNLLDLGDLRGMKDASYAMCCLSLTDDGRRGLVGAGVVAVLGRLFEEKVGGMEEKITALAGNLAKGEEGRAALMGGGVFWHLAEVVERVGSSPRALEDAVGGLLLLCSHAEEGGFGEERERLEGMQGALMGVARNRKVANWGRKKAAALLDLMRGNQEMGSSNSLKRAAVNLQRANAMRGR